MRLTLSVLAISSALTASAKPPASPLTPAPIVDDLRLFARPAVEALAADLQPALGATEAACKKDEAGGIPNSWNGLKAQVYGVKGFTAPVALASATCVFGHMGFQTYSWVIQLGEPHALIDVGGDTRFDALEAAEDGLVGVTYLDKVEGSPTRCKYTRLGWSPRSEELGKLVAGKRWEGPVIGEGPTATCSPFSGKGGAR